MIKKFKRRKVYARFKDNIWAVDLVEMASLSPFNHSVKYLSCDINVFTKYAWVKPLSDKKAKAVFYGVIEIQNQSKHTNQINYRLIKEENFTITLRKNG